MEAYRKKLAIVSLIATTIVGLVIVGALLLIWNIFKQTDKGAIFTLLSDAFFISGFIIFGIGGLVFISSTGFFDIIAYGFKSLGVLFLKITYKKGDLEKYYEYVERKRANRELNKESSSTLYIILVGLFFIGIAAFFLLFI
jgi:hypothetical protein